MNSISLAATDTVGGLLGPSTVYIFNKHSRYSTTREYLLLCNVELLHVRYRLVDILFYRPIPMVRLILALSSITWALLLFQPSVVFSEDRTTYLVMRAIMPEDAWASCFMASGITGVVSVLFGVRNRVTLLLDAFLGALLWTTAILSCFVAHWPLQIEGWVNQAYAYPAPVALSGDIWLSVASWWNLLRQATDIRHCDRRCTGCPLVECKGRGVLQ